MRLDRRGFLAAAGSSALLAPSLVRANGAPLAVPIRLQDGRVLIDCSIGSNGPWPFVIDTGGTLGLMRNDLVRSLGLRREGQQRLQLRAGRQAYGIYRATDVLFGGVVRQSLVTFAGVDDVFPANHAGSLPAGIITELPSELALAEGVWRLWPDGAPQRSGWAASTDAIREANNPLGSPLLYADVQINGRPLRVGLDTGMPASNYVYRAAAEAAGIRQPDIWAPAPPNGTGRVVRASLEVAGQTIPDALVTLVDQPEWAEFRNGILGLGILQRFDIATDPASRTVYLRANGNGGDSERYNRFGAWLDRRGDSVVLGTIGPGSPAQLAGLASGDRVIGTSFAAMLEAIYQPAGTQLPLTVEGRNGRRQLVVTLADYL